MAPAPERIVSLVPSLTELLADLGAGERIVGRTRFCVEPPGLVQRVESVGGTKNPDLRRIVALQPDLVLLSAEENRKEDFERLTVEGLRSYVVHPRTVSDAVEVIEELGRRVGASEQAAALGEACRDALERCRRARTGVNRLPAFCPIWRQPWMTFRRATYVGDMLVQAGFSNVFADEQDDFFEVALDEVARRRPRLVLLPDAPYDVRRGHREELRAAQ